MEEFMFFLTGGVGLENKVNMAIGVFLYPYFTTKVEDVFLHPRTLDAKRNEQQTNFQVVYKSPSQLFFVPQLENPDPSWLSEKAWDELCRMCDLHGFKDFRCVSVLIVTKTQITTNVS